jgi:hypothetical protein
MSWTALGVIVGIAGLIGPWIFKVHGKLAVLTAAVEEVTGLLKRGNGFPAKCLVHDEQIATLRREVDGLWDRRSRDCEE